MELPVNGAASIKNSPELGRVFDWKVMGKKETAFLTEPLLLSKSLTDIH